MGFFGAIKSVLGNYATFNGRAQTFRVLVVVPAHDYLGMDSTCEYRSWITAISAKFGSRSTPLA